MTPSSVSSCSRCGRRAPDNSIDLVRRTASDPAAHTRHACVSRSRTRKQQSAHMLRMTKLKPSISVNELALSAWKSSIVYSPSSSPSARSVEEPPFLDDALAEPARPPHRMPAMHRRPGPVTHSMIDPSADVPSRQSAHDWDGSRAVHPRPTSPKDILMSTFAHSRCSGVGGGGGATKHWTLGQHRPAEPGMHSKVEPSADAASRHSLQK